MNIGFLESILFVVVWKSGTEHLLMTQVSTFHVQEVFLSSVVCNRDHHFILDPILESQRFSPEKTHEWFIRIFLII